MYNEFNVTANESVDYNNYIERPMVFNDWIVGNPVTHLWGSIIIGILAITVIIIVIRKKKKGK